MGIIKLKSLFIRCEFNIHGDDVFMPFCGANHVTVKGLTVGPLGSATLRPIFTQFAGCEQPDQCSYWAENAIDWL